VDAGRASDEREPCHTLHQLDDPEAADEEQDDHDQRRAEDGADVTRAETASGEHRHCVDHAEGNDRDGNRLEPKPHLAKPAQGGDLLDVVEPEGFPGVNTGTVVTGDGGYERMPLAREPADVVGSPSP
jgi:hypothetical protein